MLHILCRLSRQCCALRNTVTGAIMQRAARRPSYAAVEVMKGPCMAFLLLLLAMAPRLGHAQIPTPACEERPIPVSAACVAFFPGCWTELFACKSAANLVDSSNETVGGTFPAANYPYIQLELQTARPVIAVVVTARTDAGRTFSDLAYSQNLTVTLSATTPFGGAAGTRCGGDLSASQWGDTMRFGCPANVTARYVTLQRNALSTFVFIAEITPLVRGEHVVIECCNMESYML